MPSARTADTIAFRLNGEARRLPPGTSPTLTLLDWLRGPAGLTGTKEGCAEGDCGACTVVLEGRDGGRAPVNACLLTLGQVHGGAVRTVEGLRGPTGAPHPVQAAMAAGHATQCGFCTPGIVMAAWAHAREGGSLHDALAGNLCRCTGYRPILDALASLPPNPAAGEASAEAPATACFEAPGQVFHRPASLAELVALRSSHPGAWLLAGGTDLGLRISDHRERPPVVICTLGVPELGALRTGPDGLTVGATVPYRTLLAACEAEPEFAPLARLITRLGSRQIRSVGTLGGNLGTASPIGDMLPPLLALGAAVRLLGPDGAREMPVESFITGYRRTALRMPGEVITSVWLPRPAPNALLACEKLSRRHDQDITAVGLSVVVVRDGDRIVAARVAHGGLGPVAARSPGAEAALEGARFGHGAFEQAANALSAEVSPMDDHRASAEYRRLAAGNLLRRAWLRWSGMEAA